MAASLRILFIEDDPAVATMYRLRLQMAGHVVTVAGDGEKGLRLARETLPDLVFLDIRLPRLDGMAVLEALRADEKTARLVVVVLSNYSDRDTVERALSLGAREYLIKSQTDPVQVLGEIPTWMAALPAPG